MDTRYALAALVLVAAAAAWQYGLGTHAALAWSLPFAVMLLFLAALGNSPAREAVHWFSEPPERGGGHP